MLYHVARNKARKKPPTWLGDILGKGDDGDDAQPGGQPGSDEQEASATLVAVQEAPGDE